MHSQFWYNGQCVGPCVKKDYDGTTEAFNEAACAAIRETAKIWNITEDTPVTGIFYAEHRGNPEPVELGRFVIKNPENIEKLTIPPGLKKKLADEWTSASRIKFEFGQMSEDILKAVAKGLNSGDRPSLVTGMMAVSFTRKASKTLRVDGEFYRYGSEHLDIKDLHEHSLDFERGLAHHGFEMM